MPVIGFLSASSPVPFASYVAAFHQGLGEAGYVEDGTLRLNTVGPIIIMIACPHWLPTLSTVFMCISLVQFVLLMR